MTAIRGTSAHPAQAALLDELSLREARASVALDGETYAMQETEIVVVAYGHPRPQGSKTKNQHGALYDDNAKVLKPWRDNVRSAALEVMAVHDRIGTYVQVVATYAFARPAAHYGTGRNAQLLKATAPRWPIARGSGDIDKLQRASFDALVEAGVMTDDVLVVREKASKVWAGEAHPALHIPGVHLVVSVVR